MTIADNQRVAYCGDGDESLGVDDRGKVISAGKTGSHVLWQTGKRAGDITLTPNFDLVSMGGGAQIDYGLDSGSLVSFAVRDVFDRSGPGGLLSALTEEGHTASWTAIAEDAMAMVAQRIRQDPSIHEVLGQMDEDDGSEFISIATVALLRDAFREDR